MSNDTNGRQASRGRYLRFSGYCCCRLPEQRVFDGGQSRGSGRGRDGGFGFRRDLPGDDQVGAWLPVLPPTKGSKKPSQRPATWREPARWGTAPGGGGSFVRRMKENGVEGAGGENRLRRDGSRKAVRMWMDSQGLRRNMLEPRFAHYGLASAEDGRGRKYWRCAGAVSRGFDAAGQRVSLSFVLLGLVRGSTARR